jgi:hypothetical protein
LYDAIFIRDFRQQLTRSLPFLPIIPSRDQQPHKHRCPRSAPDAVRRRGIG